MVTVKNIFIKRTKQIFTNNMSRRFFKSSERNIIPSAVCQVVELSDIILILKDQNIIKIMRYWYRIFTIFIDGHDQSVHF